MLNIEATQIHLSQSSRQPAAIRASPVLASTSRLLGPSECLPTFPCPPSSAQLGTGFTVGPCEQTRCRLDTCLNLGGFQSTLRFSRWHDIGPHCSAVETRLNQQAREITDFEKKWPQSKLNLASPPQVCAAFLLLVMRQQHTHAKPNRLFSFLIFKST